MQTKTIIIAIIAASIALCALCVRIVIQSHTIDRMKSEAADMRRQIDTLRQSIADRDASIAALTAHHETTEAIHEGAQETREAIDTAAHDIDVKGYMDTPIPGPLCTILRERLCGVPNDTPE